MKSLKVPTLIAFIYNTMVGRILENVATLQSRCSNWAFVSIIDLTIHTVECKPLRDNSYIPLPKNLKDKKTLINMKNEDDGCFKCCITRALNPVKSHPERVTSLLREHSEALNWEGLKKKGANAIHLFEMNNPEVVVNVFAYESDAGIYPLRIIDSIGTAGTVNLLLISSDEKQHYCLIKDTSRLSSSQISKNEHKKFFCLRCLNPFGSQELLDSHTQYCGKNEAVKIVMPKEGSYISFKVHFKKVRHPFVIYVDFESLMEPIATGQPDPKQNTLINTNTINP